MEFSIPLWVVLVVGFLLAGALMGRRSARDWSSAWGMDLVAGFWMLAGIFCAALVFAFQLGRWTA